MIKLLITILLFVGLSCRTTYKTVEEQPAIYRFNLSSIYNPGESPLNPDCFVYHNMDSSSSVFFLQNINELKLVQQHQDYKEYSLGIKYVLRDKETFNIVDSASLNYNIKRNILDPWFYSYFNIQTPENKEYILTILFYCGKSKAYKRLIRNVDKTSTFSTENYFAELLSTRSQPMFNNFVYEDSKYRITSRRINKDSVKVKYFEFDERFPPNPYAAIPPQRSFDIADSSFFYYFGDTIVFSNQGLYFFQADDNFDKGLLLVNAGLYFPDIMTVKQMIDPLYYLMSGRDYNRLKQSKKSKQDIDEFWFSRSNNERIAKEQIRVYYNRTRLANIFFTDYRQGYRTDMGMIYIMMGAPNVVKRNNEAEEWIYGQGRDIAALSFVFDRVEHPIAGQVYELRRGQEYQNIWGQAIATWRNGRVFLINK